MSKNQVVRAILGCVVVSAVAVVSFAKDKGDNPEAEETVVATLNKQQIDEFSQYINSKNLRRQEWLVTARILKEKQLELKGLMDNMSDEFNMDTDKSYTYEKSTKSLFEVSTNKTDKASSPERKLVRKVKSDSEALYLSRLMVARQLTEQQIFVLAQIVIEKNKEFNLVDSKLRKTYKLDKSSSYNLDNKTGKLTCSAKQPSDVSGAENINPGNNTPKKK